jgi:hypothetical protein
VDGDAQVGHLKLLVATGRRSVPNASERQGAAAIVTDADSWPLDRT